MSATKMIAVSILAAVAAVLFLLALPIAALWLLLAALAKDVARTFRPFRTNRIPA